MVFIVAEIGINHNGNLDIAKKLIDVAIGAGCDAVKFQKRDIEKVYSADVLNFPREIHLILTFVLALSLILHKISEK